MKKIVRVAAILALFVFLARGIFLFGFFIFGGLKSGLQNNSYGPYVCKNIEFIITDSFKWNALAGLKTQRITQLKYTDKYNHTSNELSIIDSHNHSVEDGEKVKKVKKMTYADYNPSELILYTNSSTISQSTFNDLLACYEENKRVFEMAFDRTMGKIDEGIPPVRLILYYDK